MAGNTFLPSLLLTWLQESIQHVTPPLPAASLSPAQSPFSSTSNTNHRSTSPTHSTITPTSPLAPSHLLLYLRETPAAFKHTLNHPLIITNHNQSPAIQSPAMFRITDAPHRREPSLAAGSTQVLVVDPSQQHPCCSCQSPLPISTCKIINFPAIMFFKFNLIICFLLLQVRINPAPCPFQSVPSSPLLQSSISAAGVSVIAAPLPWFLHQSPTQSNPAASLSSASSPFQLTARTL